MAADRIVGSKLFWADSRKVYPNGRGVVVIQGRHIFNEAALLDAAPARTWLDEDNRECTRQIWMADVNWTPGPSATDEEEVLFI